MHTHTHTHRERERERDRDRQTQTPDGPVDEIPKIVHSALTNHTYTLNFLTE